MTLNRELLNIFRPAPRSLPTTKILSQWDQQAFFKNSFYVFIGFSFLFFFLPAATAFECNLNFTYKLQLFELEEPSSSANLSHTVPGALVDHQR